MPPKNGERSASSATRFTATTPHASSKVGSGAAQPTSSRFAPGPRAAGPGTGEPRKSPGPSPGAETPEQRVARLRAAHDAAKNAKLSRFDSILARSRPYIDSMHRVFVVGLVGLTALAGVATVYTAYDMLRFNRGRKMEFIEAQKKMAVESLEAARLAYMRGDATDEQLALVDQANARQEGSFQLPSILSAPKPIARAADEVAATTTAPSDTQPEENKSRLWGLFSGASKKEEGQATSEAQRSLEEKRAMLQSAKAAFQQEKENQKKGGPLDRIGLDTEATSTPPKDAEQPKKKGWLW